jgi:hypothetical protein
VTLIVLMSALTLIEPTPGRHMRLCPHDEGQPYDAARIGNWKYLKENSNKHLFDLTKDPGEKTDLMANQTSTFERLRTAYQIWTARCCPARE